MTTPTKRTRTIAAKLLDGMCANHGIIQTFDDDDVGEVAASLQELLDDEGDAAGITEATMKLVAHANKLRDKEIAYTRALRAYHKKWNELYEAHKALKAAAIAARGTAGELDALRAWLDVDVEWNTMKRPEHTEERWNDVVDEAWRALAADAGLHLTLPKDEDDK